MRIALALLVVLLLLPGVIHGKCAFAKYQIEGTLILPQGVEPTEIRIYFFLQGMTRTSEYPPSIAEREYSVPDASGYFRVEAWMNTFSGYSRLSGDRCRRVVRSGDLFIVGHGIRAARVEVSFDQPKSQIRRQLGSQTRVRKISLEGL